MGKRSRKIKIYENENSLTDPRGASILRQFYRPPRKPAPVTIIRPPRPEGPSDLVELKPQAESMTGVATKGKPR